MQIQIIIFIFPLQSGILKSGIRNPCKWYEALQAKKILGENIHKIDACLLVIVARIFNEYFIQMCEEKSQTPRVSKGAAPDPAKAFPWTQPGPLRWAPGPHPHNFFAHYAPATMAVGSPCPNLWQEY